MKAAGLPTPVMLMVRALGAGGTERQVTEIAKALNRDQFVPHVGCFEDDGFHAAELRACGVPVFSMRMRSLLSRDSADVAMAMRRYIGTNRIRLVHTFDYPMNMFCAPLARLLGVPVVLSSQRSYRDLIPRKYIPLLRISDRLADGIVVNCEAIRRHLREEFSVPDARIATCYNAIDTSIFHPGPRERPDPLRGEETVVGAVCVLRAVKDIATLIEAFACVAAPHPSARMIIVGEGPEKEALRRQAAESGLSERILFVPATDNVSVWLRAIDIFVLPSTSEALSNSLMEAMASGCCVIASRVGGNPELIVDGETGLLFEPGDATGLARQLLRVLEDPRLRTRLADAGSRYITSEFPCKRSVERLERVYREKLARKRH